jgi:uncharacterized membrane protein
MLAVLWPALAFLAASHSEPPGPADPLPLQPPASQAVNPGKTPDATPPTQRPALGEDTRSADFVLLLITIGCLLVIAPEFIYLRDQFGYRLNTIFKFYYQAWLMWSIPAAFGVSILLQRLRGAAEWVFRSALSLLLFVCLIYPALSISNKTNGFRPALGWTLDDFRRIEQGNPDEAAAIVWLKTAPDGVVAEAIGGSYTDFGRVSEYTGLPTVLGWPGHESQWRGSGEPQGTRQEDVALLYNTPDWESALGILQKYDIRYVYVGGLERSTYSVQEEKFQQNLGLAFQRGSVTIYEAP